jgi:hypothetical protein
MCAQFFLQIKRMCALMLQLYLCLLDQGNQARLGIPLVESTHVEDVDDDSESESESEFQFADSDY